MSVIGDVDPEDMWDDADPRGERLAILVRMVLSIAWERDKPGHDHHRILARLRFAEKKVEALRATADADDYPLLDALALVFFYLSTAEGV